MPNIHFTFDKFPIFSILSFYKFSSFLKLGGVLKLMHTFNMVLKSFSLGSLC